MPFNAFPVARHLSAHGAGQKPESRETAGLKAIEGCVAGFSRFLYDYVWEAKRKGAREKSLNECVDGLRAIHSGIFDAILEAFRDYENTGRSGKRIISYPDTFYEGTKFANARLSGFSDQELVGFARSSVSFLWSIREKNLYARAALARLLAVDGTLLDGRDDKKNGVVRVDGMGTATPLNRNFNQCSEAEGRVARSERDGTYITVSKHLFVKFKGEVVALCKKTFRTASGQVFIEGVFYAPDQKTEAWLKANHKATNVYGVDIELPHATWHVLRAYNKRNLSWLS